MFFPRKPKAKRHPQEPIVPSGLIWQATSQGPGSRAPTPSAAMTPAPDQLSRSMESRVNHPARRLGAISPPIPWPSPKVPEIVRRPHSQAETEQVAALLALDRVVSAPYGEKTWLPPVPVAKPEISPPPKGEKTWPPPEPVAKPEISPPPKEETLPVGGAPPSPAGETRNQFRHRFHRFRQRWQALQTSWTGAWQEVRRDIRTLYGRIHLVERMREGGELLGRRMRGGLASARYLKFAVSAVATESRTAMKKLHAFPLALFRPIENWSARPAAAMVKVWHREIHLDIRSQAWSRPVNALKARVSGWKSKVPGIQLDSRFWTSMAMAAVSAGMVLGMISLVRHYRPADPSPHPVASPQVPVKPVKTTVGMSHANGSGRRVPGKTGAAQPAAPAVRMPTAARTPTMSSGKMNPLKARPHPSEDADYVARDTYVYYGAKGKNANSK